MSDEKRMKVIGVQDKNLKTKVACGVILIIIGFFLLINDYIVEKREKVFSSMNLELTELLKEENSTSNSTPTPTSANSSEETNSEEASASVQNTPVEDNSGYETYVGILNIPKIGFNKGFYKKESSLNNVKFNIKILDMSSYPDETNGNVIIIGHSGNYSNSYFGNLYQLELGDTASIEYQNKVYTYKIVNIYTDTKDGTVTVYRDETKNCLTLITCTKDDETTQTIYIFELIQTE